MPNSLNKLAKLEPEWLYRELHDRFAISTSRKRRLGLGTPFVIYWLHHIPPAIL